MNPELQKKVRGQFLSLVTHEVRQEVLKNYRPDSCIVSSKVVMEVLEYFGLMQGKDTVPLVVETTIYNKIFNEAVIAKKQNPLEVEGAWSLGIGLKRDTTWSIHVVVWIPKFHFLIDPSLDQASRPAKGINLRPSVFFVGEADPKKDEIGFTDNEGTVIFYKFVGGKDYIHSPNWGKPDAGIRRRIAGKVIRMVKSKLKDAEKQLKEVDLGKISGSNAPTETTQE